MGIGSSAIESLVPRGSDFSKAAKMVCTDLLYFFVLLGFF